MTPALSLPRRIRKQLRDATDFSLEEISRMLGDGRIQVRVCGASPLVPDEDTLVFADDEILLDGTTLSIREKVPKAFVLFKPKGVVTTTRDPRNKPDLRPWLATIPPGCFPVGRLDRETTGALLLVNDGDLASAILRPEHELAKLYWLWLNEHITKDDPRLAQWTQGMPLLGGTARALEVEVLTTNEHMTELHVTLQEGKNRQLRRMCRFSDFRLLHLHRKSVGPIELSGMQPGELRAVSSGELEELWRAVGGRGRVYRAQIAALGHKARQAREQGQPLTRLEEWLACAGQMEAPHWK